MKVLWMPLAALLLVPSVGGAQVLDQSFEFFGGYGSTAFHIRTGQTVVAGITGKLVRVELALRPGRDIHNFDYIEETRVEITKTYNHVPRALDEDVLAYAVNSFPDPTFELAYDAAPGIVQPFLWVSFDIQPIEIVQGEEYAIVLEPLLSEGGPQWALDFPGFYPSGEGYTGPPSDMDHPLNFNERDYLLRTFIIPIPEPTTFTLVLAAICLAMRRHR